MGKLHNRGAMLTIEQLLKNPVFADACIVAGMAGIANTVEWSHIIDVTTNETIKPAHKLQRGRRES